MEHNEYMQDNEHIKGINEEYTDFAWGKMRDILNEEMPVEKDKRNWLWLWWLLGIAILVFGVYFLVPQKQADLPASTEMATQSESTQNGLVNDSDNISSSENINITDSNNVSDRDNESKLDNGSSGEKTSSISTITQPPSPLPLSKGGHKDHIPLRRGNKGVENHENLVKLIPPTESPVATTYLNNINTTTPQHLNTTTQQYTNSPTPQHNNTPESRKNIVAQSISSVEIPNKISLPLAQTETPVALPFPKKAKFSQSYSYMLGAMTNRFNDFGGLTTGLLANYNFNSKWGIETGFNYSWTKNRITYEPTAPFAAELNSPPFTSMEMITRTENTFHYFHIPLLATFQPHLKWQIGAGLQGAYLWNRGKLMSRDLMQEDVQVNSPTVVYSNNDLKKWDAQILVGLRYYPNNRLGIGLQSRQGLIDITTDNKKHLNQGLQMSVSYRFRPK